MGKPFRLTFEFTPAAFGNRKLPKEEQFTVTVRDISIVKRLEAMESLATEAPDMPEPPKDQKQTPEQFRAMIEATKKQAAWKSAFAKKFIVRVNGFSIAGENGEATVEVKTAAELEEHCPDVLQEVADRLLFGAGEEELKNSLSPSSVASSVATTSGDSTSTAPATGK